MNRLKCAALFALLTCCLPLSAYQAGLVVDAGNGQISYSYPLRWGQKGVSQSLLENVNTKIWGDVTDADGNTVHDRFCFKTGSRIGVKLIWAQGEQQSDWIVSQATRYDRHDSSVLWTEDDCGAARLAWAK